MKKLMAFICVIAGVLLLSAPARAARGLELSGSDYTVYILCSEDLGGFCDQGKIETDTFIFDGDNFGIGSFEEDLGGLLGTGEFSGGGLSFEAEYTAIDGLDTYEFDIKGLNFADIILFGTMDITYTEIEFFDENETAGRALFIGIKK